MITRTVLRVSSLAITLIAGVGHAQSDATPQRNGSGQTDTVGVASLEEIIVTAQRRSESLQKAAVPISAVSNDALISAGITDSVNLSKLTPSLSTVPSAGPSLNIYLRGIGTSQANAFGENPVAFNYNGIYIARPSGSVGFFYDLERVEVVKGPQGTLYGRNATGGAINVLPHRPLLGEFGGDFTLEYGNYDATKVIGALNLPIGDRVAVRLATQIADHDAYLSDGYDDDKSRAGRASVLFKPSDELSFVLVGDYYHQGGHGGGGVFVPSDYFPQAPAMGDRIGVADPRASAATQAFAVAHPPADGLIAAGLIDTPQRDGFNDNNYYGLSGQADVQTGFGTLSVIPAWRRSEVSYRTYAIGFLGESNEDNDQTSLEIRLASNEDQRLRHVVGAYYFQEKTDASNQYSSGAISTTLYVPHVKTASAAAFGQLTFDVTDSFRLVGGARYTDETHKQHTALGVGSPASPIPVLGDEFTGKLNFSKVTWKAGVEFDAGPDSLLYANVATGFKAGGFFVAAPPDNTFDPEELTAYTIGSKNRFIDNRLQFNVEAFYWDYKDQQINFVGGVNTPTGVALAAVTRNAGSARLYGVETELMFALTARDTLSVDVQYLNGKYESLAFTLDSPTGQPARSGCDVTNPRLANPGTPDTSMLFDMNCADKSALNSPEWSATLAYEHSFPLGTALDLLFGARSKIESSRELTMDYLPETHQSGYTMSDAYLTLQDGNTRWSVTGFVNNIEDETVKSNLTIGPILQTGVALLRPPRTYGVRASMKF